MQQGSKHETRWRGFAPSLPSWAASPVYGAGTRLRLRVAEALSAPTLDAMCYSYTTKADPMSTAKPRCIVEL